MLLLLLLKEISPMLFFKHLAPFINNRLKGAFSVRFIKTFSLFDSGNFDA
jgi:hypothetical protein